MKGLSRPTRKASRQTDPVETDGMPVDLKAPRSSGSGRVAFSIQEVFMTYKVLVAALAVSIATSSSGASGTAEQKSGKGQASVGERKYCIKYGDMTGTRVGVQIDDKKAN